MVTIIHHTMVTIIPGHGDQHRGKGLTVRAWVFTFKKKTVLLRSSFDCITILQKRILASGSHGIFAHYGWSGIYIGIHIEYWLLIIFLPSTTAAVTLIRRRKSLGSIANCYRSSLGSWRTAATGSPCDLGDLELWSATCPHWSCLIWSVGTKEVKWSEDKCYLLSLEMRWTTRADWISLLGAFCPSFLPFYIENHFQWEGFLPSMLTKPKNYLK